MIEVWERTLPVWRNDPDMVGLPLLTMFPGMYVGLVVFYVLDRKLDDNKRNRTTTNTDSDTERNNT